MQRLIMVVLFVFSACGMLCGQLPSTSAEISNPLAGGIFHTHFLHQGSLYSMGQNVFGQLGVNDKADALSPVKVGAANNYISISTGTYTSLALRSDGTIWGWGFNTNGEVGNGKQAHQFAPTQIGKDTNWFSISAGETQCYGIKRNGTLWG